MLDRLQSVFSCLNRNEVRYLVIGGIAAVLYGVPRATFDLDILIEATESNSERMLKAFLEAGLGTASLTTSQEVLANEITVFNDRVRVDVQTETPGITFQEAWRQREEMEYGGTTFPVASKQDIIASKRAAGRPRDLEDVQLLELGSDDHG